MSRRRSAWFRELELESRLAPAAYTQWVAPTTDIARSEAGAFTRTEIMAGLWGADPLREIDRGLFDIEASRVILEHEGVSLAELKLLPGISPLDAVAALEGHPLAAWAEPNRIVYAAQDLTPNDPRYSETGQYFHRVAQTELAWDTTTGTPNIIVAVTDDGVGFNHPDLIDNIWTNPGEIPGDGKDNDGNGFIDDDRGWDFSQNDNNALPTGSGSHGTHCAGIIAARSNNGIGVAGTAGGDGTAGTGVRIMPVRWDGSASWTASVVASSFTYAANNGAKIVSSSYNFDGFATSSTVKTAFEYSYGKGLLHFNSAGNNNQLDAARGVYTQTLFVANLNSGDVRSSSSNYGDYVDISGHGSSILSTTTNTDGTGVNYEIYSGTSMSTPHAAGAAALIWSANPGWSREQVVAALLGTADNVDSANTSTFYNRLGTGRINPYRALTQTPAVPQFGRTVNLPLAHASTVAPASFQIFVPDRLDPASVKAANFELRSDGADNTFDTTDDVIVPLTINSGTAYQIGTNNLSFAKTSGGSFAAETYRLTAFSGSTQLRSPFGTPLDGDTDGTPGGHWVRTFTWLSANVPSISGRTFIDFNGNGLRDAIDPNINGSTNSYYLDADNDSVRDTTAKSTTATPALAVPSIGRVSTPMVLSGFTSPVFDVDVKVNITHPRSADLDLFLVSPNGVRVALATDVGGSGANFVNTVFSDEAGTAITAAASPMTGTFRPEASLTQLDNVTANGTWLLEVIDDDPSPTMGQQTINSWTITITTTETTVTTDASGNFAFNNLAAGKYVVRPLSAPASHTATAASKSYSVTLATPTSNSPDRDFGYAQNGSLYGVVVNDANANSNFDSGEAGLAGQVVFHDANLNGLFDNFGKTTVNSTDTPLVISDNTTFNSSITVAGISGLISDVNVTANITHTYVGDLRLRLTNPAGTQITLVAQRGGSGDNFVNTVFDDEAATAITAGAAPFTGFFRPEGLLSTFDGLSANGTWKLEVADLAGDDTGTLNSWSITFESAEVSTTTGAGGAFTIARPAGSQTLGVVPSLGWRPTNPVSGLNTFTFSTTAPLTNRNFLLTTDSTAPLAGVLTIDSGTGQRSRIRTLTVPFSERVRFGAAPFSLTGPGGPVSLIVSLDAPGTAATITFTSPVDPGSSLPDGKYQLSFNAASITDMALNPLAPAAAVNFHRLFGDIDGNATVDATDFGFFPPFGSAMNHPFDFNANGDIDSGSDLAEFGNRFGMTL